MPARDFLDTNVLVYAYDVTNARKQQVAQEWVKQALLGNAMISTQVLAELSATLLHKVLPAARAEEVRAILDALAPIPVIAPDAEIVRRAVDVRAKYGVHFYDGMIVAAAERTGCSRILSEDLSSGQKYFGITVENPFEGRGAGAEGKK